MTNPACADHCPWPLFSNDLFLAQQWLRWRWRQASVSPQLLHWGLSLGLKEELATWLRIHPGQLPLGEQHKLAYRLARLQRAPQPYQVFFEEGQLQQGIHQLHQIRSSGHGLRVRLNGGIGDHLQDLSLICSWSHDTQTAMVLETEPIRVQQLTGLLSGWPWLRLAEANGPPEQHPLTALAFGAFATAGMPELNHGAWLNQPQQPVRNPRLLCCWRSEGRADRLSCFLRSVPLGEVLPFYRALLQQSPGLEIVDITAWKTWERALLPAGVTVHNPSQGPVAGLMDLVLGSFVVSIDTALAHLCAVMAQPAWVLLPRYADERWLELRSPRHCYGQVLSFIQQTQFGDWRREMQHALETLTDAINGR